MTASQRFVRVAKAENFRLQTVAGCKGKGHRRKKTFLYAFIYGIFLRFNVLFLQCFYF